LYGEDSPITSRYSILAEQGAVLSFNTYNSNLHYFSEPGGDSGVGPVDSGMGGDFEFMLIELSQTQITLKGKQSGNILQMRAIGDDQVSPLRAGIADFLSRFDQHILFSYINPAHEEIEVLRNNDRSFLIPSLPEIGRLSFHVSAQAIHFYETHHIDGIAIEQLTYYAPTAAYPLGHYANETQETIFVPKIPQLNEILLHRAYSFSYIEAQAYPRLFLAETARQLAINGIQLNELQLGTRAGESALFFSISGALGNLNGNFPFTISQITDTTDEINLSFDWFIVGAPISFFGAGIQNTIHILHDLSNDLSRNFNVSTTGPYPYERLTLTEIEYEDNSFNLVRSVRRDPLNN